MPLDRTWYNTLVDDDGSGLTGSIWDKEDVNQLMNSIDASLPPRRAQWQPVWQTAEGNVCPLGPQYCFWHKVGDAIFYSLYSPGIYVANATAYMTFDFPPGLPALAPYNDETIMRVAAPSQWAYVRPSANSARGEVRMAADAAFVAGATVHIQGQGFYWWR
jgi:hypothetical protein